jgi:cyclohexyl-isocyanide hydratase
MIDTDRRNILLAALLAPLTVGACNASAHDMDHTGHADHPDAHMTMPDSTVHWEGDEQIAMLMYPGMTMMDLIGPQSMFGSLMGAKIHLVAKTMEPVTSDAGVTIVPTATFDTCPRELTVIFTPGGTDGTLATARDHDTLAFMSDRGSRAKYVTSVCSGSLILGAAGLLKGYKATSHWSCRDALAGFGAIPTNARVVRDRNRITGAGVTAGLDFGLTMVAELRSRFYAECTQLVSEYDPHPPFNAGSMKTAPTKVKADMIQLLSGFKKKAEQLASDSAISNHKA